MEYAYRCGRLSARKAAIRIGRITAIVLSPMTIVLRVVVPRAIPAVVIIIVVQGVGARCALGTEHHVSEMKGVFLPF